MGGGRRKVRLLHHPLPALGSRFVRQSAQDTSPSSWRGGFDSRTDHFSTRRVAELVDARASEARAPEAWEFESPPGDWPVGDVDFPGEAGARLALMRPVRPARYRGLGLR